MTRQTGKRYVLAGLAFVSCYFLLPPLSFVDVMPIVYQVVLLFAFLLPSVIPSLVVWFAFVVKLIGFYGEVPSELLTGNLIGLSINTLVYMVLSFVLRQLAHERNHLKKIIRRINYMDTHDRLSGLPNRRVFSERLNDLLQAAASPSRYAVLFLDIDRFRMLNDSLGHHIGDLLIQKMGHRLEQLLPSEALLARQGGDEFCVCVPIRTEKEARLMVERLLAGGHEPFSLQEHDLTVTLSMGIALFPADGSTAEELMKHADAALCRAKESGRGKFHFYTREIEETILRNLLLEREMSKAIAAGEFEVHYQPQVQVNTNEIIGVEALVRWNHPTLGAISPGEFIPLAEETGLIVPLGESVLRTACKQMKAWLEEGLALPKISVNLSPVQVRRRQDRLCAWVHRVLEETGLSPSHLVLEITESVAMQEMEFVLDELTALRELGVQIAMDDFGTGYSSLSYLKRFPIDTLKIDQFFIRDLTQDPSNKTLVDAITRTARSMQFDVIAEGVETEEQLAILQDVNCLCAQGYLFSRPIPADEVRSFLLSYGR